MTPEGIERLRRLTREALQRLEVQLAGGDHNAGGIRAVHYPGTNLAAYHDARNDASLGLDVLTLLEAIDELEQKGEP